MRNHILQTRNRRFLQSKSIVSAVFLFVVAFGVLTDTRSRKVSSPEVNVDRSSCTNQSPDTEHASVDDMASWLRSIGNIHGENTDELADIEYNTAAYQKEKQETVDRFFDALKDHPQLQKFAKLVDDPETGTQNYSLIVWCRGVKTESKRQILDACLLCFAQTLIKKSYAEDPDFDINSASPTTKAKAQYQPNFIAKLYKHLFAYFKASSIIYTGKDFAGEKGTFQAYHKKLMNETAAHRADYGTKPNQAAYDDQEEYNHHLQMQFFDQNPGLAQQACWHPKIFTI